MALADLTTLASVKAYAGVSSTIDDGLLGSLITACSAWVRAYLGRDITTNSYDIRRSGRGTQAIQLPHYPVTGVQLLEIDGVTVPAQTVWRQPGYRFDDIQIALDSYCFTPGIANIRIQFTAGYANVPPDLGQAINELVTLRYRMRDKLEWSSKGLAGETVSLVQRDMPASVATLLVNWRCVAAL
jgi:uncharacterized phiE125 gp8 family phage protein